MTYQDAYLNHLIIYFEEQPNILKYENRDHNRYIGHQVLYDIASKVFIENKIILAENFCFPNFGIKSDTVLNNINIQDAIPALKKELGNVHIINIFHSPIYKTYFSEVGFSHITESRYTQQSRSIDIRKIEKKTDYVAGDKESYIQTYMIHDYFTQKNIHIDLEHLA